MVGDLDVIVGCDATLLPLGILVRRGRKRLQCWPIDLREQLVAAHSEFAHDLGVEVADARVDRRIEFSEREEAGIAQSRQHEPLDNLHRHFDLGLVARFARTRRQDRGVVVLGQFTRVPSPIVPGSSAAQGRSSRPQCSSIRAPRPRERLFPPKRRPIPEK